MFDSVILNPPCRNENVMHRHLWKRLPRGDNQREFLYMRGERISIVRAPGPLTGAVESYPALRPELNASYRFSVMAHAVIRTKASEHPAPDDLLPSWLEQRLSGFRVVTSSFQRLPRTQIGKNQKGRTVPVLFTGTIEVTDHGAALKTWRQGVGRLKAFGYGLLILTLPTNTTKETSDETN